MKPPKFGVIGTLAETSALRFINSLSGLAQAQTREMRLDALTPGRLNAVVSSLASLIDGRPTILTYRSKNQGGMAPVSIEEQYAFWQNIPATVRELIEDPDANVIADFDFDLVGHILHRKLRPPIPWNKVGCSAYTHEMPDDLPDFLKDLHATPAQAYLKLVARADSEVGVRSIEAMIRTHEDPRPLIAYGIGTLGKENQKRCMLHGSAGVHGHLSHHLPSEDTSMTIFELLQEHDVLKALAGNIP